MTSCRFFTTSALPRVFVRSVITVTGFAFGLPASQAAPVSFNREIRPLMSDMCFQCHGFDARSRKAGMRLDVREDAIKPTKNDLKPIVPGKPEESELIFRIGNAVDPMPPEDSHKKLTAEQKDLFRRWIAEGAVYEPHWAYVPPVRVEVPRVDSAPAGWSENPIDGFILARLVEKKIEPAPAASASTLLRRVSLDLTGLPPTPEELTAFLADPSPSAYRAAVERLLASPHYGERWGRHWLDVARYADSNGYSIDAPRQIWKYRDWVVAALNRDLPYDQFVVEQLAGDLLPGATLEQKIATGYNRNTQINQEGGIDIEQFRVEAVMDRVNNFGAAFLGLTVGCAQCHDHKFDPISQRDYYQLFAFFNQTVEDGHGRPSPGGVLEIPGEFQASDILERELEEASSDLDRYLGGRGDALNAWWNALAPAARDALPEAVRAAHAVARDAQTLAQKRTVYLAYRPDDPEFATREKRVVELEKRMPRPVTTLVMSELPKRRDTVMFIKGDFTRPGDPVTAGTPSILPPLTAENPTRLDLARWLFRPEHPLTARVMVNRVWQAYFGRGLVESENDFGTQGLMPTHPELLDFLATEFVAQGWSLKALHRLIVTSATYRQSAKARPDLALVDPTNLLLGRQTRLRLDAELVRDVALAVSGELDAHLGGPPVFPPQPDGVMKMGQLKREWIASKDAQRHRRGLYTHFWRATPHPALVVFDAADGISSCTRRLRSNTPLQALTLLNDRQFFELAVAFAQRIEREAGASDSERIRYAFQLCTARPPTITETTRLTTLMQQVRASVEGSTDAANREATVALARVALNLDETITRE
ncbi:MAG TPA: PSD1 and planctomycete cytochrome C domain-containing protein [Opitutaceae bacterium]|nr:PSD1 and planctomycete cytochrome C domain-containing protein [Opitutaceae bacterium]